MNRLSDQDIENIEEIRAFLEENEIEYHNLDYGHFCLNYGNPNGERAYEICYIPSLQYPMTYEKFGIYGVPSDYFFQLSWKAENEENSFKCWVKDFEWMNQRQKEVLKSYWLRAANKIPTRIYARDCEVREVPTREARDFEAEHCFYGKRGASLNLGLYLKKEKNGIPAGTLMMLYTFGKNFFGRDNSIEVLRVGTRKNCIVTGGASKLLKHFLNNYPVLKVGKNEVPVSKIKFYSDYCHNIGNSLSDMGFEFLNYSGGGFMNYWTETQEVKQRQPAHHKWVMQQMAEGNVIAVPNAGVKTFVMHVNREDE